MYLFVLLHFLALDKLSVTGLKIKEKLNWYNPNGLKLSFFIATLNELVWKNKNL